MHSGNASHLACCYERVSPALLYLSQVTNAIDFSDRLTPGEPSDLESQTTAASPLPDAVPQPGEVGNQTAASAT